MDEAAERGDSTAGPDLSGGAWGALGGQVAVWASHRSPWWARAVVPLRHPSEGSSYVSLTPDTF